MPEIIDIHAHIFPGRIAEKAVSSIGKYYGIKMSHKGTVEDLLESGSRINVSKYVVHSSATVVEQVRAINDYIAEVQSAHPEFVGFATLHPGLGNVAAEVDRIIGLGLRGIKLHPEFQRFSIDDDDMMPIYEAVEGRLPVLMHMGDENADSSSPVRLSRVLDRFPGLVVIAAHFGGYRMWDLSCEYLIGRNVYLDTSSTLAFISPEQATDMIRKHGADKVLFGSDYPMWDHREELERFMALDLTEEERKAVLYGNAEKLLLGRY
ncbi:MAG TPA: amidohydrolase family protein [Clostridiales bacterium]|nr:amidohydrolase family protein [Clostridiales bacterium]HPV00898.1 amidohydrolase family protein [Clostridiales bacterium]